MLSVYVPALNEEEKLRDSVLKLIKTADAFGHIPLDVIIVNDGSTDRTPQAIAELESQYPFIRSIHHSINQGPGCGVREAIQLAKYPKFLVYSGDDAVDEYSLGLVLSKINKADLIMVYIINNEIRGRKRLILSRFFSLIYITIFDVYVQYINGGWIYPTELLKSFEIKSKRFSYVAELVTKSLRSGCTYYEIPYVEIQGLKGSTSFSFRNLIEVISTFFKLVFEIKISKRAQFNKKPIRILE